MTFTRYCILFTLVGLLAACTALPQALIDQPEVTSDVPELDHDVSPMDAVQVESPLGWTLVERVLEEEADGLPYVIKARWPNLEGDPVIAVVFNAEIDRRVNDAVSTFINNISELGEASDLTPKSFLELDYELTLYQHDLVSVYLMFNTYIAVSAHPFPSSQSLNFDLEEGRFLTLADLFEPNVDPLAVILPVVEPDLLARDLGFTPGLAEGVLEAREHWNLLPEGLRINFDVYEVGPYAAGHQTVLIPWGDLVFDLNPDGPIRSFTID